MKRFLKYIWSTKKSNLRELTKEEYFSDLQGYDDKSAKAAFDKAWEIRNFEIEMYWKRATYFWAFIASTFVGYFALIGSDKYSVSSPFGHDEVFFLICIGFVLSFAWFLTNKGSKSWQRHWEIHIDLLEDAFTGPLYKTVHQMESYSVSKINEIVSVLFIFIWILLAIKFLVDNHLINAWGSESTPNYFVVISASVSIISVIAMIKGHGRGRFGRRNIVMYRRDSSYKLKE